MVGLVLWFLVSMAAAVMYEYVCNGMRFDLSFCILYICALCPAGFKQINLKWEKTNTDIIVCIEIQMLEQKKNEFLHFLIDYLFFIIIIMIIIIIFIIKKFAVFLVMISKKALQLRIKRKFCWKYFLRKCIHPRCIAECQTLATLHTNNRFYELCHCFVLRCYWKYER